MGAVAAVASDVVAFVAVVAYVVAACTAAVGCFDTLDSFLAFRHPYAVDWGPSFPFDDPFVIAFAFVDASASKSLVAEASVCAARELVLLLKNNFFLFKIIVEEMKVVVAI